jgi:hypothetical protein
MGRQNPPPFDLATLQKELNLSEEQTGKVKAILEESWNQLPRPWERPEGAGAADGLRQIREKMDQEIEKVLTDDQKEKFREFMKRRPPMADEGQAPRPPSPL